jgi:hypothetical protein
VNLIRQSQIRRAVSRYSTAASPSGREIRQFLPVGAAKRARRGRHRAPTHPQSQAVGAAQHPPGRSYSADKICDAEISILRLARAGDVWVVATMKSFEALNTTAPAAA